MITVEHVRELFASDDPGATLVVVDGRPEIVSDEVAEPGGFVVARLDDLSAEHGPHPPESEYRRIAEALNTAVSHLGG